MSSDLERVEERERKRFSLLKAIYDNAGDSTGSGVHFAKAFRDAGLEEDEGHDILEYLMDKGLLSNRTGTGSLALSHAGIIEMEQSITHPEAPTAHFKRGVVQKFYSAVGVVQNAADSTASVEQNNEVVARALNTDQQLVAERQERRRRLMRRIYEKADGNVRSHIYYDEVQEEEGLSDRDFNAAFDYLKAEGLVNDRYKGGVFEITQRGIEHVERQIKHPNAGDESNSSGRHEQHFYGPVGAVQNAPGSRAYVTQNNVASPTELLRLVQELREKVEALPDNQEALEQVNDLEEEARSENPKRSRIIAAAKYIGGIVKDVGVSVAAEAIVKAAGG